MSVATATLAHMFLTSLEPVERAVRASWAADTCSPDDMERAPWTSANPAWGHCDVTALVVNDLFGGDLMLADVHLGGARQGYHYWNRLPSGTEVDLTREQFQDGQILSGDRALQRPPGRLPRRWDDYLLFRRRVMTRLDEEP